MAKEQENNPDTTKPEKKDNKTKKSLSVMELAVIAVVVVISSAAGFGICTILAKPAQKSEISENETSKDTETDNPETDTKQQKDSDSHKKTWFYDLDPVVANLDVPGATRYVRATLTLELSSELASQKGKDLIDYKKPLLTNWLTIYLAGLSLEDVRGERNLRRIQAQTLDAFNTELFGSKKPMIVHVLLKEFPIQ